MFEPWLHDPQRTLLLTHANGLHAERRSSSRTYKQPARSTIRRTSTARAKSPPAKTRSRSASSTATRTCRATRTCATRGQLRIARIHPCRPEPRARHSSPSGPRTTRSGTRAVCSRRRPTPTSKSSSDDGIAQDSRATSWSFISPAGCRASSLAPIDGLGLRPALLAPLPRSRARCATTFPHQCCDAKARPSSRRSLSGLVDAALRDVAPRGIDGERMRRHGAAARAGNPSLPSSRCHRARSPSCGSRPRATLGAREGETLARQAAAPASGACTADGEAARLRRGDMPARLLTHAWRAGAASQGASFRRPSSSRLVLQALGHPARRVQPLAQRGMQPQSLKDDRRAAPGTRSTSTRCRGSSPKRTAATNCPASRRERSRRPWRARIAAVLPGRPRSPTPMRGTRFDFAFDNRRHRRGRSASACRSSPNCEGAVHRRARGRRPLCRGRAR